MIRLKKMTQGEIKEVLKKISNYNGNFTYIKYNFTSRTTKRFFTRIIQTHEYRVDLEVGGFITIEDIVSIKILTNTEIVSMLNECYKLKS